MCFGSGDVRRSAAGRPTPCASPPWQTRDLREVLSDGNSRGRPRWLGRVCWRPGPPRGCVGAKGAVCAPGGASRAVGTLYTTLRNARRSRGTHEWLTRSTCSAAWLCMRCFFADTRFSAVQPLDSHGLVWHDTAWHGMNAGHWVCLQYLWQSAAARAMEGTLGPMRHFFVGCSLSCKAISSLLHAWNPTATALLPSHEQFLCSGRAPAGVLAHLPPSSSPLSPGAFGAPCLPFIYHNVS